MIARRAAALALAVTALVACGGSGAVVARSQQFASTAHAALNGTRDAFVAWDAQHQLDLVERADSMEAGKAALASYRARRKQLEAAFQAAYAGIAAVAALVPLVEAKERTAAELVAALAEAASAVDRIRKSVDELTLEAP